MRRNGDRQGLRGPVGQNSTSGSKSRQPEVPWTLGGRRPPTLALFIRGRSRRQRDPRIRRLRRQPAFGVGQLPSLGCGWRERPRCGCCPRELNHADASPDVEAVRPEGVGQRVLRDHRERADEVLRDARQQLRSAVRHSEDRSSIHRQERADRERAASEGGCQARAALGQGVRRSIMSRRVGRRHYCSSLSFKHEMETEVLVF